MKLKLTKGARGGGKGNVAYFKDQSFPACVGTIPGLFLRTCYDCDGRTMGKEHSWPCRLKTETGVKEIYIIAYGILGHAGFTGDKLTTDKRSVEMMAAGCCPPELIKDFIMQEGGGMVERDPVEEAMKLHKRGYFGGGG